MKEMGREKTKRHGKDQEVGGKSWAGPSRGSNVPAYIAARNDGRLRQDRDERHPSSTWFFFSFSVDAMSRKRKREMRYFFFIYVPRQQSQKRTVHPLEKEESREEEIHERVRAYSTGGI